MKNFRIYTVKHELRCDGRYYDQVILETRDNICILFERRSKNQ